MPVSVDTIWSESPKYGNEKKRQGKQESKPDSLLLNEDNEVNFSEDLDEKQKVDQDQAVARTSALI